MERSEANEGFYKGEGCVTLPSLKPTLSRGVWCLPEIKVEVFTSSGAF